jgi:two-component system OmpR family sensor kinase
MAFRALLPFLLLMPVMALLIWLVVGRSLSPLHQLAQDVSRRSPDTLTPLPENRYPPELRPMLAALNNLLARLAQALATQRAFVADAAHELRTPLAALQLQLQLVERENSSAQAAPGFRKLHERLDRATHLVRQLLTLARQERHAGEPPHRKLDLQALIASTVSDHAPQAESKGVDLGLLTPPGGSAHPVIVSGDQDNLRIMLGNLIDNAIRYTPQGGRVDVSVTASGGDILLLVADNGPGIPEEDRRRVFDRFYRREGNGESGSGLGLFIAQTIAERHGATIVLDSTDGNGGLSATVRFPTLRTDAEQAAPLTQQDQSR